MAQDQDRINQLLQKLESLTEKQEAFSREIKVLKEEIYKLHSGATPEPVKPEQVAEVATPQVQEAPRPKVTFKPAASQWSLPTNIKGNVEKFIGENLISKIGIAITVIGVGIGAKYAIDHQLISPLTRIILGYLAGIALLGFAIKLKKNYENFSAVLLSGAMAILYFITYAAYGFYDLIPQALTFVLMVVFTAFTVLASIQYNRQVIAHIGLVGAYAVPFLLSDGSGRVEVLFSYMAIINAGILIIAVKRYWKPLYVSAFVLTWLIFLSWYGFEYKVSDHFGLALVFLTLFFLLFYAAFLAYKVLQKEKFEKHDILLLFANSFIFFGIGYSIFDRHEFGGQLLGLFSLGNAVIHFAVSMMVHRQKLGDRSLLYFIIGLVLVFLTISVPVQLDGNWVTLLWAGEAALLFWIGRTKGVPIYEKLAYPLIILAFVSLAQDWMWVYGQYHYTHLEVSMAPFLNIYLLTSLLVAASFAFIYYLQQNAKYVALQRPFGRLSGVVPYLVPTLLLVTLYFAFRLEIANYWNLLFAASELRIPVEDQDYSDYHSNYDLLKFRAIWVINYSLFFFFALSLVNIRKLKNRQLAWLNLGLNALAIGVFLVQGLYSLSELRDSYLSQYLAEYYHRGWFHVGVRYVSYIFAGLLLWVSYQYIQQDFLKKDFKKAYDFLLHVSLLWIVSSELIHWMDMGQSAQSYKLGLSILWGVYSLALIALGIWKNKQHLRVGAIVLFGITLLKLFFYDIVHLDTIAKTVVFVSLGVLLLVISFLYNKYKQKIFDEPEN